jgi:hypothetical protein
MLERGSSRLSRHPPSARLSPPRRARGEARRDRGAAPGPACSRVAWRLRCVLELKQRSMLHSLLCSLVRSGPKVRCRGCRAAARRRRGRAARTMREPAPAAMQPPRRRAGWSCGREAREQCQRPAPGDASVQRAAPPTGRAPSPPLRTGPLRPPCLARRPSPRFVSREMRFSTAVSTTTTTASASHDLLTPTTLPPVLSSLVHHHPIPTSPPAPLSLPSRPLIPQPARPACRSPPRRMASSR